MINPNDFQFPDLSEVYVQHAEVKPKRALLERIEGTDDFILKIDNTTMETFQTCPRSAFYYTVQRIQRPDRAALIFGGAIHAGLEVVYRDGFEAFAQAKLAILDHFEKHPFNYENEWRTPAYAIQAFAAYVSQHSLMDNLKPVDKSWVEKAFALNIGSFEVNGTLPYSRSQITDEAGDELLYVGTIHAQFTGKIDILGYNGAARDRKWVVDHKTTSMGGETFYSDFDLAQQTHGYMWAAQEITGERAAGFVLNALIIRKPSRTGVGMEFDRRFYPYTQESLDEWKNDFLWSFENFVHSLINDQFPKYTKWCMGKYGKCQYHQICTLPADQRKFMIHSDAYENVTWSPLNEG